MISIGSDLIDIRRIEKTLNRFGNKFKNRIFTQKEIEKCVKIIRHEMENVFDLRVKLKVDINYGNNWLEAH